MAYDSDRGVMVFFGGEYTLGSGVPTFYNDTWEYDGTAWRQITTTAPMPVQRSGHAMCYDSVRKKVVLFGGVGGGGFLNDTWTYEPTGPGTATWVRRADMPGFGRAHHTMAFDTWRQLAVVAGGTPDTSQIQFPTTEQVWEWNGQGWTLATGTVGWNGGQTLGQGIAWHAMTFDSRRGDMIVNGGYGPYGLGYVIEGNFQIRSPGSPAFAHVYDGPNAIMCDHVAWQHAMVYDSRRDYLVIFGGTDPSMSTYLHEEYNLGWAGPGCSDGRFAFPYPSYEPPPRARHAMVYDSGRGVTVVFGGASGDVRYDDTWELSALPAKITPNPPLTQDRCVGQSAFLSAFVSGAPSLKMQWYHGTSDPVPGGTNATLLLNNLTTKDSGAYSLSVADPCGNVATGGALTLVVHAPPDVTAFDSSAQDRCPGGSVAFSVLATSTLPIRYQWQKDGGALPGATDSTLTLGNLQHTNTGDYDVIVSNDCGLSYVFPSHLQVGVTILEAPLSVNSNVCQTASFSVAAAGVGPLRYQWRLDGAALTNNQYFKGVTNSLLSVSPLLYAHEGNYDVVITDDCGPINAVTSNVGKLVVLPGPQWFLRATNGPPARNYHALAYDSARDVTVLFGGTLGFGGVYQPFGDLWEWNGAHWTQRTTYTQTSGWTYVTNTGGWVPSYADVPVRRHQHAMAFDSRRKRVVLFGGLSTDPNGFNVKLGDTWEWDGLSWHFRATNGPPPRYNPTMAYDSDRGVTVMDGGVSGIPSQSGLVWEWNGTNWTSINPPNGPSEVGAGMAYDSFRRTAFLGPSVDERFWCWNGTNWIDQSYRFDPSMPTPISGSMVFNSYRRRSVYFGGSIDFDTRQNETASWDGRDWTLLSTNLVVPAPRGNLGLAYDSARHAVVMMGGDTNSSNSQLGDTWELIAVDTPLINDQPASQYRQPGETAVFSVTAAGPGTLAYQWLRNGQPVTDNGRITGSTTATLTITNVTNADPAQYSVRVSDDCGSTTSFPAILTLDANVQVFSSTNTITLAWGAPTVVLEQADSAAGPWTPVPGAVSPFAVSLFPGSKFFRLH